MTTEKSYSQYVVPQYSLYAQFFTHTPVFPTKVRLAPWKTFKYATDTRYNAPPPTPVPSLSMNCIVPCTSMREACAFHDVKCKKQTNKQTNKQTKTTQQLYKSMNIHTLLATVRECLLFALNLLNPLKLRGTYAVLTAPPISPSLLMKSLKEGAIR